MDDVGGDTEMGRNRQLALDDADVTGSVMYWGDSTTALKHIFLHFSKEL